MKNYTEIIPIDNGEEIAVNIDEQLQKIIKDNDSVWIIAVKSFELGQKHQ
jgi:hypothetical protein